MSRLDKLNKILEGWMQALREATDAARRDMCLMQIAHCLDRIIEERQKGSGPS